MLLSSGGCGEKRRVGWLGKPGGVDAQAFFLGMIDDEKNDDEKLSVV
jgi:hypothetical protein